MITVLQYEAGYETPEIMGSGSTTSCVLVTKSFDEAFSAYQEKHLDYLKRIVRITKDGKSTLSFQYYNDETGNFE